MRAFIGAAIIILSGIVSGQAQAQVNFGVSVGDRNGFYLELGNYYRVPERDVVYIHDRRIDDDEIPVVFFFADAAGVPPVVIADLRRDGWSWRDIAYRFRLDPALFYVPAYGMPDGYARYHSYRDWRRIDMRDDDFIRFANVRFLSEHYRWDPRDVMRMREQRRNYYILHNDIHREWANREHRPDFDGNNGNHYGWRNKENGRRDHEGWNNDRGDRGGWDNGNRDNGRRDHGNRDQGRGYSQEAPPAPGNDQNRENQQNNESRSRRRTGSGR
ncbi:MAG TPA: hypothetical protein VK470_02605 [Bacteroidota bacterium]|nr:hypothetical protein [Bacteroidota bacterium]